MLVTIVVIFSSDQESDKIRLFVRSPTDTERFSESRRSCAMSRCYCRYFYALGKDQSLNERTAADQRTAPPWMVQVEAHK